MNFFTISLGDEVLLGPELWDLNKPVIAAVNGLAVGGGFELALAADLIIASTSAEFFVPEATLGLIPDSGGVLRLPRRLPKPVAMDMLMTGRRMGVEEAKHYGLVNRSCDQGDLINDALEWEMVNFLSLMALSILLVMRIWLTMSYYLLLRVLSKLQGVRKKRLQAF